MGLFTQMQKENIATRPKHVGNGIDSLKEVSVAFPVAFQARDGDWDWNREAVVGDA